MMKKPTNSRDILYFTVLIVAAGIFIFWVVYFPPMYYQNYSLNKPLDGMDGQSDQEVVNENDRTSDSESQSEDPD